VLPLRKDLAMLRQPYKAELHTFPGNKIPFA
jgi:hypothetical protein